MSVEQIGPYKVLRRLNTEGRGELYEALHEKIHRRAAIKILRKELSEDRQAVKRFMNEARIVNVINHPSLVSIYETGQLPSGAPYIIMEYLQGEMLRERIRRAGGRLEPIPAMRIARQVASAVAAAHAKRAVHRDIKPANIMLIPDADTQDGERVKLLNFGLAKLTTIPPGSLITQPGAVMGTPSYMSPEQCQNAHVVTDRSDVYSLGILLYEMLSGATPFSEAAGPVSVMMAHMHHDPPPLITRVPDAPPQLGALVQRMLAKAPTARPSAAEVAAVLARLCGSKSSTAVVELPAAPAPAGFNEAPTRILAPRGQEQFQGQPALSTSLLLRTRGRLIVSVAAVAVCLGLVGLLAALRALRTRPVLSQPVTWSVRSEPADAQVVDSTGQALGRTPWQLSQPRGRGLTTLTVRHPGYVDEALVVDYARDGKYQLKLTPLPAEPVAPVAPVAPLPAAPALKPASPSGAERRPDGPGKQPRSAQ